MRVFSCADIHLGNHRRLGGAEQVGINLRCRQALRVLQRALSAASEGLGPGESAVLVVQGDVFDYSHAEPQLIAAVQDLLSTTRGLEVVLLVGNHDQDSTTPGDHALAPLRDYATVVDAPRLLEFEDNQGFVEVACVPFNPAPASEWLEQALDLLLPALPEPRPGKAFARLVALHLGIADDETPAWLRGAKDSIHIDTLTPLLERHRVSAALAGNWHNHALWEDAGYPAVVQVGALVPTGWDNPGLDELGGLAEYDPALGKVHMRFLPGPRFVKATSLVELETVVEQGRRQGHDVYVEATLPRADVPAGVELVKHIKARGDLCDGVVLVDTSDVKIEARTAAHAARKADTLDEALAAYVKTMPMDEGVSREGVLDRARAYLKGGRGAGL